MFTVAKTTLFRPLAAALFTAALLAPTAHAASNAGEALSRIEADGYVATHELALRHGLWTASATTPDGKLISVILDPANDTVTPVSRDAFGTTLPTAQAAKDALQLAGYRNIRDIEFDDGFWEAEARKLNGEKVDLVLHPVTLEVLSEVGEYTASNNTAGGTRLTASEVRAALEAAGYRAIRDLDFDDGVWEADATNPANRRVELKIDPVSGQVLREKLDD